MAILDRESKIIYTGGNVAWLPYIVQRGFNFYFRYKNGKATPLNTLEEYKKEVGLVGYEVKKETEKRYVVKLKELRDISSVLRYNKEEDYWEFGSGNEYGPFRTAHTRKELEKAKFGKVFNNPLFDVEEIKTK